MKGLSPYSAQLHFFYFKPYALSGAFWNPRAPRKTKRETIFKFEICRKWGRKCAYRAPEHFRAYVKSDEKAENIEGE